MKTREAKRKNKTDTHTHRDEDRRRDKQIERRMQITSTFFLQTHQPGQFSLIIADSAQQGVAKYLALKDSLTRGLNI